MTLQGKTFKGIGANTIMEATKVFTFFFLRGFQNYSVTSDRMNLGMVTPPGRETLVSLQRLLHHSREIFFV